VADRNNDILIRLQLRTQGDFKAAQDSAKAMERELGRLEAAQRSMAGQEAAAYRESAQMAAKRTQAAADVGKGVAAAGAVVAAGMVTAVKAFADFDEAMSSVKSSTGAPIAELDKLRQAAIDAGSNTKYSATEAAGAINELAKAGVSTGDILNGGLAGALNLAAAGQIDVADAAETAASAMTQFNLKGAAVPHIADLLAAGANKAQGSVDDLGQALAQSGLVASQMGLSVDETIGTLSAFASAGLLGSDAGTSFKTMLLALANPSSKAAQTMSDLGIAAYDAQGNFVGVAGVAEQLKTKLSGLSQEQRDSALATIFGSDAIRAAAILYKDGAQGINDWVSAVDDQGIAAKTAATNMDNLKGDVEQLKGSLETLLITLGGGQIGDWARQGTKDVDGMVDSFNQLPPEVQGLVSTLGALVAGIGLVGGAALILIPKLQEAKATLATVGITADSARVALARFGTVATATLATVAAVYAGTKIGDKLTEVSTSAGQTEQALVAMATGAKTAKSSFDLFDTRVFGQTAHDVTSADDALAQFAATANRAAGGGFREFYSTIASLGGDKRRYSEWAEQLDASLAKLVTSGHAEEATAAFEKLKAAAVAQGVAPSEFDAKFGAYGAAVAAAGSAAAAAEPEVKAMSDAQTEASGTAKELTDAEADLRDELAKAAGDFVNLTGAYTDVLQRKQDADREAAEQTAKSTKDGKDSWQDYVHTVHESVDEYLAELQRQVQAQQDWAGNLLSLSSRVSQGTLDELAKLGPEGAPLVAQLVNGTDAQLADLERLMGARTATATGNMADELRNAGPVLAAVAERAGKDTADAYARKLAAGETTVAAIAQSYGLTLDQNIPDVKNTKVTTSGTGEAASAVRGVKSAIDSLQDKTVTLKAILSGSVAAADTLKPGDAGYGVRKATGGYISGPGTGTSDSIPALLSNGEYVVRASSTDRHRGLLEAINRDDPSVPRFATGGPVVSVNMPSPAKLNADVFAALKSPAQELQKAQEQAVMFQSVGSVGAGVERWRATVLQALAMMGLPASLADTTLRRMNQESGGNPNIFNNWDSNAKKGTPSGGLMQTIAPTFRAYHFPGTSNNMLDPLANILASMRYALSRYGSLPAAYNRKGGYAEGGPVRGPGGPREDAIPAWLSNGEFVVNAAAAKQNHGLLTAINAQRFATGGLVTRGVRDVVSGAGPTVANGSDLASYLRRNMALPPTTVDDSPVRAANADAVKWTSQLAIAEANLAKAKLADETASDALRDAESKLSSARSESERANEAATKSAEKFADVRKDADKDITSAQANLTKARGKGDKDAIASATEKLQSVHADQNERLADAQKDLNESRAEALKASQALADADKGLAVAQQVAGNASSKAAKADDEATGAKTAYETATKRAADALADFTAAQAEALAYAKQIASAAMAGSEITGLFTAEDTGRALKFAEAAYKASVAQAQATTEAESYQSAIDQVAASGAKLAATQAAIGASYATQKATLAATRAEVDALARSYGFTAEQAAALAESAVPLANSGQTLVDSLTQQLKAVQDFSRSVGTLRALGLSQGLIDQILQAGPEKGLALAQELISGGSDMVKRLNDLQAQLVTASNALGTSAAQAAYSSAGAPPVISRGTRVLKAAGGAVHGPGTGTSDSVPAYLSNGEYVVKAAAVARYGPALFDDFNAMRLAGGGQVPYYAASRTRSVTGPAGAGKAGGVPQVVNTGPQFHAPIYEGVTVRETVDADVLWQRAPLGLAGPLGAGGGR